MPTLAQLRDLYAETGPRPATLFLLANGPSLASADLAGLAGPGIVTMGVNNGGHLLRPHLWCCVDHPQRFMASIWEDPRILKFVPRGNEGKAIWDRGAGAPSARRVRDCPGVATYPAGSCLREAVWLSEPRVTYGHKGERFCVLMAALKVAYVLGFRRVYLLGVDWRYEAARPYFFDEERTEKHARQNESLFRAVEGYLRRLRPWFDRAGFRVYNCNPRSGLRVFEHRPLGRAIESAAVDAGGSTRGMYVPRG